MGISLDNYKAYIKRKPLTHNLDLIDLLYISYFKGGNASIHVKESDLALRLIPYVETLKSICGEFSNLALADLTDSQTDLLIEYLRQVSDYCETETTSIDGFKTSYFSALFHAYLPSLIPILDRRVLIAMGIVTNISKMINGQVMNIHSYFPILIREIQFESRRSGKTLRELDGEYFQKVLPSWASRKLKS